MLDFLICGFQHLFILFKLWILSTSMCNYLLMRVMGIIDVKFNPWNLYSRRRGHLCWNIVEELIKIDSTGTYMFDLGTSRWNCWVCFAGSALQAVNPHDQIGIGLIHTTDHGT